MLPSKTNTKWEKLITGETDYSFKVLAGGLMLSRLRREAKRNPDAVTTKKCVDEIYGFFTKYEAILTDDISSIFGKEQ